MKAEDASGKKLSLTADGALVLSIGEDIDLPVKVWVPIKDIIFYTQTSRERSRYQGST